MPAVFVHVSDIHFGQEKGDDRVHIHDDVKQQLISDARHVVSNLGNGVAHGILVTGDIAHSGTKAEYDSAGEWLDELASSIGAEIHCVQMVPGNHDLDRSKLSLSGKAILDHIRKGGPPRIRTSYEQRSGSRRSFCSIRRLWQLQFWLQLPTQ